MVFLKPVSKNLPVRKTRRSYRSTDRPSRQVKTKTALLNCLEFPSFSTLKNIIENLYPNALCPGGA